MKVWKIRTASGQPIMFDEEVQILPDGRMTEFCFTDENVAKTALLLLTIDQPNTKFKILKTNLKDKDIAWAMDEQDVHDKAEEVRRQEKEGCKA